MSRNATLSVTLADESEQELYPITDISCITDFKDHIFKFPNEEEKNKVLQTLEEAEEVLEATSKLMFDPLPFPTAINAEVNYTGETVSPGWNNFNDKFMDFIEGGETGIHAGDYVAKIKLRGNAYYWEDDTQEVFSIPWKIKKIAQPATVDKNQVSLSVHNLTDTILLTKQGDGAISATSSNEGVCTVEVVDNKIHITAVDIGDAVVNIKVAEGTDYLEKTIPILVHVDILTELKDTPVDRIQLAANNKTAPSLWSVGDSVGITLDGTVDGISVPGNYKAVILGFDHNQELEGRGKIHFSIIKDANGQNVTFSGFRANVTSTNAGGYESSKLRDLMHSFLDVLPEDWKNCISVAKKYTDNIGGMNNDPSSISATQDKIFLLSAYEITGDNNLANTHEKNYQAQYDYYANGNSKVKYSHRDPYPVVNQWTRSPSKDTTLGFCYVDAGGNLNAMDCSATTLYGINPSFVIG